MLRLVRTCTFAGVLGLLGFPATGQAYCRSTTGKAVVECPSPCATTGTPLYWAKPNLTYAFNVRPFEGFDPEDVRRIFADSFAAWTSVQCMPVSGEQKEPVSVGLSVTAKARTTTDAVGPEYEEPNDNAMIFFSADEWDRGGYDSRAFALTSLWFRAENSKSIGEIVGADIYFNGGMNFGECPATGCPESQGLADLQNVATHEVGHFFGLAHSDRDPEATMWCDARAGQVNKRTLSDDDRDGLCAVYAPGTFNTRKISQSGGCNAGSREDAPWAYFAGLLLLLGLRGRSKRGQPA